MNEEKPSVLVASQENNLYYINCCSKISNEYTPGMFASFLPLYYLVGRRSPSFKSHSHLLTWTSRYPIVKVSDKFQVIQFTHLRQVIVIMVRASPSKDKPQPTYVIISNA